MASRTAANGLLRAFGRAASTGILPVLAVAGALAVSGCGEDSSSTTGTASGASSASDATGTQGETAQSSERVAGQENEGKQGRSVAVPKGKRVPAITPEQKAQATLADIVLTSSSFVWAPGNHTALARASTCYGDNTPPTLHWEGVPEQTEEIILLMVNMRPVGDSLFFDWAVAGLDPGLTEIKEGELPETAILGKNGFGNRGYSVCPPEGKGETYAFTLYALPRALHPKPGFDPMVLREAALDQSRNAGFLATTYNVY